MTQGPCPDPKAPLACAAAQAADWWLLLKGDTQLTPEDDQALAAWLVADAAHRQALDQCATAWAALDEHASAPEIITRRSDALNELRRANRLRWMRPSHNAPLRSAAAAALLALAGGTAWYVQGHGREQLSTNTGERRALTIADGSRISMDAKTTVSVGLRAEQRSLSLSSGRAKFDVAYEPNRPFTVQAAGRIILATGTSFSTEVVGNELRVIVYEGKVVVLGGTMPDASTLIALRRRPSGDAIALVSGQQFVARGGTGGIVRSDAAGSLGWEAGRLEFTDATLADAVVQLNRYSADEITIADARTAAIKVNGIFKAGNSAAFLDALARLYPVSIRPTGPGRTKIIWDG